MKKMMMTLCLALFLLPAVSFGCNVYLASNSRDMNDASYAFADMAQRTPGYAHLALLSMKISDVADYMHKKALRGRGCQYLKNEYLQLSAHYSQLAQQYAMAFRHMRNPVLMRDWREVELAYSALVETFQGE